MNALVGGLRQSKLIRFYDQLNERFNSVHLKELPVASVGPHREMRVGSHQLVNFGFDSFLGLDQHPRVKDALARGAQQWGTQFGASRAFASCQTEVGLEERIARWIGTDAALIFPSVTLTNMGALPALVEPQDLIVVDEFAHNSILEGTKLARAAGVRVVSFAHDNPDALEEVLRKSKPYRNAVVAIDGVYSMSGEVADMAGLNKVALRHNAVLYVDDAHATGVMGDCGRGTVYDALGGYENAIVVGCFSKACSVFGAFVACSRQLQRLLKMRSTTYIFGGPVPPPYLEAAAAVIDLLCSDDYLVLRRRLDANVERAVSGFRRLGLTLLGGKSPILSVLVGDEEETFLAGKFLFDRGYYVQSVTFPAVPYHAGVLRVQINANHTPEAIDGLIEAFAELKHAVSCPLTETDHEGPLFDGRDLCGQPAQLAGKRPDDRG
ncbi:MAG TPA: pyridoxal phosphate-dependent aminotransferase family protein [Pirellulales bacterium]|nr:pyridoxal phosphate-dependent aminotransferase family protein [Pirellulales bacterium]